MPDEAVTAYNFVPFPERILDAEPEACRPVFDRYEAGRHTGWFEIECEALTPLYTRGVLHAHLPPIAEAGKGDRRQPADFFHRGEEQDPRRCRPVLPGSSLRGMVRSVFEVLTNSRVAYVNDHRLSYRFFAGPQAYLRDYYANNFQAGTRLVAGVLRRTRRAGVEAWSLEVSQSPATAVAGDPLLRGFVAVHRSDPMLGGALTLFHTRRTQIVVSGVTPLLRAPNTLRVTKGNLWRPPMLLPSNAPVLEGWLNFPGKVSPRSFFHVILDPDCCPGGKREYEVPAAVYRDYVNWGDMTHGKKFQEANAPGRWAPRRLEEGAPAFALIDPSNPTRVAVIGANLMMPLRYRQTIRDVITRSYADSGAADMTEVLFGSVPVEADNPSATPIKGRVDFEDAVCASESWYLNNVNPTRIPSVLMAPKPAAAQVYLKQPDPTRLRLWDSKNAEGRGIKREWHQENEVALRRLARRNESVALEPTQTLICPVRARTRFRGRIRFANLSYRELGALYAAVLLPWGPEDGSLLAHKFGMAKSLGLGSLRITVNRTALFDMAERYTTFGRPPSGCAGEKSADAVQACLDRAYTTFVRAVHGEAATTLWQGERLWAMANLLSWNPHLDWQKTRYVGIQDRHDKQNYDPLAAQWRERRVLRPAEDFAEFEDAPVFDVRTVLIDTEPESLHLGTRREFSLGETIEVTVLPRLGGINANVRIDDNTTDGYVVKSAPVGRCDAGTVVLMIVTSLNGEGRINGLKRPSMDMLASSEG